MNENEIDELDNILNFTFATLVSTGKDKEVIEMGNAVIRDHHLAPSNVFTIQILELMVDSAIKQGIDDDDILEYYARFLPFYEKYIGNLSAMPREIVARQLLEKGKARLRSGGNV